MNTKRKDFTIDGFLRELQSKVVKDAHKDVVKKLKINKPAAQYLNMIMEETVSLQICLFHGELHKQLQKEDVSFDMLKSTMKTATQISLEMIKETNALCPEEGNSEEEIQRKKDMYEETTEILSALVKLFEAQFDYAMDPKRSGIIDTTKTDTSKMN